MRGIRKHKRPRKGKGRGRGWGWDVETFWSEASELQLTNEIRDDVAQELGFYPDEGLCVKASDWSARDGDASPPRLSHRSS